MKLVETFIEQEEQNGMRIIHFLPWRFYQPSKISHGSYWHFWGTEEEVAWKENYGCG